MLTRSLAVLCVVALPAFFLVFSAGAASQLATTRLRASRVLALGIIGLDAARTPI
jgi:hypothetical protein